MINSSALGPFFRALVMVLFVACPAISFSQPPLFKTPAYVNHYSEIAVQQMVEYRIPASVILAQAIFESNCGTSFLAQRSNNHFGIKCHVGWKGDTILKDDDTVNECFRSYESVDQSYTDHSLFLRNRPRYSALFELNMFDYKAWCKGLKAAGYATYSLYAEELIQIIEANKLYEYDRAEKLETREFLQIPVREGVKESDVLLYLDHEFLVNSQLLFKKESAYTAQDLIELIEGGQKCVQEMIICEGSPDELDITGE